LTEAIKLSKEKTGKAVVHEFTPVDEKEIRNKANMSQTEFASAFGIGLDTLRRWEHGDGETSWFRSCFIGCHKRTKGGITSTTIKIIG